MPESRFESLEKDAGDDFTQIHDGLVELSKLKKQEKEKEMPYAELINELPEEMRGNVLASVDRFKSYGLTEDQLQNEVRIQVEQVKASYIDRRFNVPNQSYLRLEIGKRIDAIINDDPQETEVKGMGLMSFDLNGLKAVNDIAGHQAGTEYLKRIAEAFKSGHTTTELKARGVEVFFAATGGDEFSIFLTGQHDLSQPVGEAGQQTLAERICAGYESEIAAIDCSDLVDFSLPEVEEKFTGLDKPEDFRFHASASGGQATLMEAVMDFINNPEEDNQGRNYQSVLHALMGRLLDTSDKRSIASKKSFKEKIAAGTDEEKFLSLLLKRNAETMELEHEIQLLRGKLAEQGE